MIVFNIQYRFFLVFGDYIILNNITIDIIKLKKFANLFAFHDKKSTILGYLRRHISKDMDSAKETLDGMLILNKHLIKSSV